MKYQHQLCLGAFVALVILVTSGCNRDKPNNFSHVKSYTTPLVEDRRDHEVDYSRYRTFTISRGGETDDPLARKQLLWVGRQELEAMGYQYVEDPAEADLFVGLAFSNGYGVLEEPSRRVLVPQYIPGATNQSTTTYSGSVGAQPIYGAATTTTTTAGRWTTRSYTRPPRRQGAYFPAVTVVLWDPRRSREGDAEAGVVWMGMASGCTNMADIRISGNMLLLGALTKLPLPLRRPTAFDVDGMRLCPATPDGSITWPVVFTIVPQSPAAKAGVEESDIIAEINGHPTADMPLAGVLDLLSGNPGETKHLIIKRLDRLVPLDLKLGPNSIIPHS